MSRFQKMLLILLSVEFVLMSAMLAGQMQIVQSLQKLDSKAIMLQTFADPRPSPTWRDLTENN